MHYQSRPSPFEGFSFLFHIKLLINNYYLLSNGFKLVIQKNETYMLFHFCSGKI